MNTLIAPFGNKKEEAVMGVITSQAAPIIASMPDDTMQGEIELGEQIAIDTQLKFFEDGIYAFWWGNCFMVKRLQFMADKIRVIPTSRHYITRDISTEEAKYLMVVGRVVVSQEILRH
ncbi:S24 family peptidase [Pantoea sp. LMR881]|uniref:S24 family peptidase n=1 Tax=Pantoea sp. LMR881 TaxID=3014336 RepID=UPI0022AFF0E9|nr:S24 family peptidase [Pantoea sp. LMR881]MCZ4058196.1 S24 family peptidase [Pantoea sp. LMR881]